MSHVTALFAPRLLVVEDEALIAEEIHDRLQRLGYRVVGSADTGPEAIRAAVESRPDLVLMDIRLKGEMDGITAAELIRGELDVPVVYLTAHSDQATLQRARSTAPFGYVLKPFQEKDLLVAIEMALQRHGVEQRLRESEARYATTLASIGDGVIATDLAGQVTFMNPVAEQLTGWPMEDARGLPLEQVLVLLREADRQREENPVERALRQRTAVRPEQPLLLVPRAGEAIPFEDSAAPIVDDKGRTRGAVMAFRDGRPRRRAEDELRRVEEQLLHAQKMEAIGRLASGVAHDFNNLVTAILGHSELLLAGGLADEQQAAQVREIQRAGERAAELTRKLLAYARRQVLAPEVLDLVALVDGTEVLLRSLVGGEVELHLRRSPVALPVCVDPGQVEQVLMNLAVNARDAMSRAGVLSIETSAFEGAPAGGALPDGAYARLVVRDTGVGMDAETQAHMFEPFFTTKPPGIGTGLGLATVYGIVVQSGGHIEVESEPGRGAAFALYLPLVSGPLPARPERAGPGPVRRGSETILLVEDEQAVRSLSTLALQSYGYTVLTAAGVDDAVRQFDAHGPSIQLIVTDVVLPGTDGRWLAERLAAGRALPVLYLSDHAGDAELRLDRGHAFLAKPFTPSGLAQQVRELLDQRRRD